ncbi:hypothetical protein E2C01_087405 [Portunus trituberculatus]|uniref:Uncharacterized protein n=1 Tax=Portunus trituberculatus TaxID=210409 RepID=A0A5B7JD95_PORTR|nr:hypothetical protein [Portunus trituberculatus]
MPRLRSCGQNLRSGRGERRNNHACLRRKGSGES